MTDPLASPVAQRMLAALPAGEHEDFDLTPLDRVGLPVRAASSYPAAGGGRAAADAGVRYALSNTAVERMA